MATFSQSTIEKGSDMFQDFLCSTCEDEKLDESADYYCESCVKFFCRKCIHMHGQLFKKHSPHGRGDMKKWPVPKKVEDFLLKCDAHKQEHVNMFCEDHSKLCCIKCAFRIHRQCKQKFVSDLVKNHFTDLKKLSVSVHNILGEIKNLKDQHEASIRSVQSSYDEQLQQIQKTRRKLDAALDMIEKKTLQEMKDTLTKLHASLKSDVDTCTSLQDELKQIRDAIQDISDKNKLELSFVACIKCMEKIKQSETFRKKNFDHGKSSISFQPNNDIEQYLSKVSGLGRIEHSTQTLTVQGNPDQVIRLNGKSEYDVSNSETCCIKAICVLADGQFLVVDSYNDTVKLLNQQYGVVDQCRVTAVPQDICQIAPSEVAVTVDVGMDFYSYADIHEVQFIKVINNKLVKGWPLEFEHECYGICHHQGDLLITSGTALHKYTLKGKLVSKLHEDLSDMFAVFRCAVSPAGDTLYGTNRSQHKLLTSPGMDPSLQSSLDPALGKLVSVHVTPAGQVLVCGGKSRTILQVESKGRRKLATLATEKDGLQYPRSVCYNSNTASIIVVQKKNRRFWCTQSNS